MRRALVAAISLASATALVSGVTMTAAQASPGHPGASQPAASQPAARRAEHFRIISTVASSRRQSVLATGGFIAGGYLAPGRLNPSTLRATGRMVFPNGSFLMYRHVTKQWLPLPTASCMIRETIHGTFVLGRGAGIYRGISGSGSYVTRITGVIRRSRSGKCGGPMSAYQLITYASASVRR
jgi:hypothetical protein